MKIYKKKGWEKPSINNLSIKSLTLSGPVLATIEETKGQSAKSTSPTPS
jgi:hypothetical protein